MKSVQLALLALPAMAMAQNMIRVWKKDDCSPDAVKFDEYLDFLLPEADTDGCIGGVSDLGTDWPRNSVGDWEVYVTGDGIGDGCSVSFLKASQFEPDKCGETYITINGGTSGACRKTTIPYNSAVDYCCNNCQITRASSDAAAQVPKIKPRSMRTSPDMRRADCSFSGSETYLSRGAQQVVASALNCPESENGAPCSIERNVQITTGSSNTFGTSTEAGGSFFEIIQASVSFSYEYSYSESETTGTTHTVNVPSGQTGVMTFTPTVECVDGQFAGDCDGWTVGEDGTACIPREVSGQPDGTYAFVQQI